jgi:hypothetical protein
MMSTQQWYVANNAGRIARVDDNATIASVHTVNVKDYKLVAAAPDLANALGAVLDGVDNWSDKGRFEKALELAHAALKKAGLE